jgi:hypothetical protein
LTGRNLDLIQTIPAARALLLGAHFPAQRLIDLGGRRADRVALAKPATPSFVARSFLIR